MFSAPVETRFFTELFDPVGFAPTGVAMYGSVSVGSDPATLTRCSPGRLKRSWTVLPLIACNLATLAIAVLYYTWRDSLVHRTRQRRMLHERVAYMLWAAASRG